MLIAGRSTAHASAQRFHQVNYVFTFGRSFGTIGLPARF
jgi:hypothetical protein